MMKKTFIKKNVPLIIFVLSMIGVMIYTYLVQNQKQQELQLLIDQREHLQNKIESKKTSAKKNEKNGISGLDYERIERDKDIMSDILSDVLTWDTYEKYNSARNNLIQTYRVRNDDRLLTEFMPKIDESYFIMNAKFDKIADNYVTAIEGSDYKYFSIVTISSKGKKGGRASGEIAFTYSMNKDGIPREISAFVVNP